MTATEAAARRMACIVEQLALLQEAADACFEVPHDGTHWGHVGDLDRIEMKLREAVDLAKGLAA